MRQAVPARCYRCANPFSTAGALGADAGRPGFPRGVVRGWWTQPLAVAALHRVAWIHKARCGHIQTIYRLHVGNLAGIDLKRVSNCCRPTPRHRRIHSLTCWIRFIVLRAFQAVLHGDGIRRGIVRKQA
jgi:hypothetical protein